jgi:hypothetical protein
LDMTSLTRCGIGALDPTHGHAVEAAAAGGAWAAATANSDADVVARANAMISGLFLDMNSSGLWALP